MEISKIRKYTLVIKCGMENLGKKLMKEKILKKGSYCINLVSRFFVQFNVFINEKIDKR